MAELRWPGRLSATADLAGICPADPAIAIRQFHPGHTMAGVLLCLPECALRPSFRPFVSRITAWITKEFLASDLRIRW